MVYLRPEPLEAGDLVRVVAPAGPTPPAVLLSGLAWLRQRYRVKFSPRLLGGSHGFLAATDAERLAEMEAAFADREARAIVCARGGYGCTRILDALRWDALLAAPKWLVGFSDITAIHSSLQQRGLASVHGPNVSQLARRATPSMRAAWIDALEHPSAPRLWSGLEVLHRGPSARGPIVGGNLALLDALAAGGSLAIPRGAVLALEDVGERPYRLDRMLTSLRASGELGNAAAVVFGGFDDCGPGADGVTAREVLAERTAGLGVITMVGAPFGHGARNDAFVLGSEVEVDEGVVRFLGR